MHTSMIIAVLLTIDIWNQTRRPLADEWIMACSIHSLWSTTHEESNLTCRNFHEIEVVTSSEVSYLENMDPLNIKKDG